jgi:hypothetical protein
MMMYTCVNTPKSQMIDSSWPSHPRVVPTGVPGEPVLRGAMLAAVDQARAALLASVANSSRPQ